MYDCPVSANSSPKTPRTIPFQGAWCAVALHLAPAGTEQGGFYLTMHYDGRPNQMLYLRAEQLLAILDRAVHPNATDGEVWDMVAKTPMEPLPPSRFLSSKLRPLLLDIENELRTEIKEQLARRPPLPSVEDEPDGPATDAPPTQLG